jgi:hypothetical protein
MAQPLDIGGLRNRKEISAFDLGRILLSCSINGRPGFRFRLE